MSFPIDSLLRLALVAKGLSRDGETGASVKCGGCNGGTRKMDVDDGGPVSG